MRRKARFTPAAHTACASSLMDISAFVNTREQTAAIDGIELAQLRWGLAPFGDIVPNRG
jgi:hypothetical protein